MIALIERIPRWLRRAVFWAYAAVLFLGTHWPNLKVPGPGRTDLGVHLAVFGVWGALLIAAGYWGPALSRRNIVAVLAVGPVYAAVDEALQAIPVLRRVAAWDDWAFNCLGIALACGAAWAIGRGMARAVGPSIGPREGASAAADEAGAA